MQKFFNTATNYKWYLKNFTSLSVRSKRLCCTGGIKFSTAFPTSLRNESLAGRQLKMRKIQHSVKKILTLNILSWRQCNHILTSFFGYVHSYVCISLKHFVWFVSRIYGFKQPHCFRVVHVTYATVTINILLAKTKLLHMVVGGNV